MKVRLLGVRGSRPTHAPGMLEHGGNTTSFEFMPADADFRILVDGGTGLAHRSQALVDAGIRRFHILATHTHWDHVLGYPFCAFLHRPDVQVTFYGSTTSRASFEELLRGTWRPGNLPIPSRLWQARCDFVEVTPDSCFQIEQRIEVRTFQLNHQGVTLGYAVHDGDASGSVITDNAPIEGGNHMGEGWEVAGAQDPAAFEQRFNAGLTDFLTGVHTVIFDTHFTEANLKADWGHSTPERALGFCGAAGVSRLVLHHHAPEDTDDDVRAKVAGIADRAKQAGIEVVAGREGDEWDLG